MMGKESPFAMIFQRKEGVSGRLCRVTLFLMAIVSYMPTTVAAFVPSKLPSYHGRTISQRRQLSSCHLSALPFVDVDILRAMTEQVNGNGGEATSALTPKAVGTFTGIGITALGALGAIAALTAIVFGIAVAYAIYFTQKLGTNFVETFRKDYPERFEELKHLALTDTETELASTLRRDFDDDERSDPEVENMLVMWTILREEEKISRGILKDYFSESLEGFGADNVIGSHFADALIQASKKDLKQGEFRE